MGRARPRRPVRASPPPRGRRGGRLTAAALPPLIAISDRRSLGEARFDAWDVWVTALAAAGIEALQLREKDLADHDLWALARRTRSLLPPPALLSVNGRADVALAAGADGVHLPADGVPVAPLRRRFGRRLWIGRSTHRLEEVEAAHRDGADYVTFGPVFATPGKGPPVGLAGLAAASATGIPVYALGGITLDRLGEVAATGAMGAAGIRLFQDTTRLAETIAAARACFAGS